MNISEINEAIYSKAENLFMNYLTLFYVCRRLLQEQKLDKEQQAHISAIYTKLNSDLNANVEAYKKADPKGTIQAEDSATYEDSVLFLEKQDLEQPLLYDGEELSSRIHLLSEDLLQSCNAIHKDLDAVPNFKFDYSSILKELKGL